MLWGMKNMLQQSFLSPESQLLNTSQYTTLYIIVVESHKATGLHKNLKSHTNVKVTMSPLSRVGSLRSDGVSSCSTS